MLDAQNLKSKTNANETKQKNPQTCNFSKSKRNIERNTCRFSDTKLRPIM